MPFGGLAPQTLSCVGRFLCEVSPSTTHQLSQGCGPFLWSLLANVSNRRHLAAVKALRAGALGPQHIEPLGPWEQERVPTRGTACQAKSHVCSGGSLGAARKQHQSQGLSWSLRDPVGTSAGLAGPDAYLWGGAQGPAGGDLK